MIRKKLLLGLFIFIGLLTVNAQLTVTTGNLTPQQYVQDVLVGNGVTVSNVTFSGSANQIGEFEATNTSPFIGINSGIVIATGDVNVAVGPNNSGSADFGGGNFGASDSDLDILEGQNEGTNDAAILEFDFVPSGDSVKFNFVFGSEEYPEYVNDVNDVFGFFLSGPGINGTFSNNAENIALIPGTNTEISINTVNGGANSSFYVDNTGNSDPNTIQFDGYTTVIEIKAAVECNETYHIKIAIADAFDTSYDSGVFLEGGSFNSEVVLVDISVPTLDIVNNMPAVIEGCRDAVINFTRPNTVGGDTIHFEISGDAENGVDYNLIADSVVFTDGQETASITISPVIDGPDDYGQDTVIITYQTVNPCGDTLISTGSFLILDVPNLMVNVQDTSICPTALTDIYAEGLSAVPPFTYHWVNSNGDTVSTDVNSGVSSISVPGLQNSTYYVYVTDSCELATVVDTIDITVLNEPVEIDAGFDATIYCPGQQVNLIAWPVDSMSQYNYSWSSGASTANTSVSPLVSTLYIVTATDACTGTNDIDSVMVTVDYASMNITGHSNDTILECIGLDYNLEFYAEVENGTYPYSYNWSGNGISGTDSLFSVTLNAPGFYSVTITDDCGVSGTETIAVSFGPYTNMTAVTSDIDTICSGTSVGLSVQVADGIAPYSYSWANGQTGSSINYEATSTSSTSIDVTITDKCEQAIVATVEVPIKVCEVEPMNVITPNGDGKNEVLYFRHIENFTENHLVVFNRWGKKIFEADNYQNEWNGDGASDGTYFYILELNDSKETIHKGTFTIFNN